MIWKICGPIINLGLGFSILSSYKWIICYKPLEIWNVSSNIQRPMSSKLGIFKPATYFIRNVTCLAVHFHTGICTCAGRLSVSPFTPADGSLGQQTLFPGKCCLHLHRRIALYCFRLLSYSKMG